MAVRTLVCGVLMAGIASISGLSQSFSKASLQFAAASVKPTPVELQNRLRFEKCTDGGRFRSNGAPLMWAIQFGYRIPDSRVVGAPAWVTSFSDAYDIEGTAQRPVSSMECAAMVQSLLIERFKIGSHAETREVAAYALVVVDRGKASKLRRSEPRALGGVIINGAVQQSLSEGTAPAGWRMARLAEILSGHPAVGRIVVDKTNLEGTFGFSLKYAVGDGDDGPSIFTALPEQLGLKLQPSKVPVEVLVIDHIERSSPN